MGEEAKRAFKGELLTNKNVNYPGVRKGKHYTKARAGMNSGTGAISVGVYYGGERGILLGCDGCYEKDGQPSYNSNDPKAKKHWHGDHIKGLGNAKSIKNFYSQFQQMAQVFWKVQIINCSALSVLDFWPKMSIEQALWGNDEIAA